MAASSSTAIDARPNGRAQSFVKRLRSGDELAYLLTFISAASVVAITALLVWELFENSHDSRVKFGWAFLWNSNWDPVNGQFGALPFIYGTLVTSALAMIIGIPLGVGAAIFLAELAPPRVCGPSSRDCACCSAGRHCFEALFTESVCFRRASYCPS
jgi:phosphate transport system permease protein